MKTYQMECDEPWFSLIRSGIKPVEGRKNSPKYQPIKPGDCIEFTFKNDKFRTIVTKIEKFETLEDYLNNVTIEKTLPGVQTLKEALQIYLQWSSPEEIARWGFLGIFVKPIN